MWNGTKKKKGAVVTFIQPQLGTHGPLVLTVPVKVRHFSCSPALENQVLHLRVFA